MYENIEWYHYLFNFLFLFAGLILWFLVFYISYSNISNRVPKKTSFFDDFNVSSRAKLGLVIVPLIVLFFTVEILRHSSNRTSSVNCTIDALDCMTYFVLPAGAVFAMLGMLGLLFLLKISTRIKPKTSIPKPKPKNE